MTTLTTSRYLDQAVPANYIASCPSTHDHLLLFGREPAALKFHFFQDEMSSELKDVDDSIPECRGMLSCVPAKSITDGVNIPIAVKNCTIPVDVVIHSSDGIGAHMKNLEQFCTAFPIADSVTHQSTDVVILTETEKTLLSLLKYTHYDHHDICDLSEGPPSELISLTAAADKYGNFFLFAGMRHRFEVSVSFSMQSGSATYKRSSKIGMRSEYEVLEILPSLILTQDLSQIDELVRSTMHLSLDDAFRNHTKIFLSST
ncbi:hypothetical protein Moror_5884 [Moniliophthora roreri MCA 2997]|uniref:Uncharacterized protein n=1 Tax=Moniliophthora roreri (strain MCA 2997) TaxID=1381753 RepID=V2WY14_MONRO|nr:hypothetical protein Moror_5884 [Moniliophthora roreri MCA 2997]